MNWKVSKLFGMQLIWDENSLRRKNTPTVSLKTGRFDNIDWAVIISSVSKAVQSWKDSTA